MKPVETPGLDLQAACDDLAIQAAAYLAENPGAEIAGAIHERGTLEWKHLRVMKEQQHGVETADHWLTGLLDRGSVYDCLRRGAGAQEVWKLDQTMTAPTKTGWLPILVTTAAGKCTTCAVELPGA